MILGFQEQLVVGQIYRNLAVRPNPEIGEQIVPFMVMRESTRAEARARVEDELGLTTEEADRAFRSHEIMGYDHYYEISVD